MRATRCKMRLTSIEVGFYPHEKSRIVKLAPVSEGSDENKKFFAATPSGALNLTISADAAERLGLDQWKINSEFYVDITPCNQPCDTESGSPERVTSSVPAFLVEGSDRVRKLIDRAAAPTSTSGECVQFSQAANNVADALCALQIAKEKSETR